MSQANNGQYEEMVQNYVCWIFFANTCTKLKQSPKEDLWVNIGCFWASYTNSKQQIVLEIKNFFKKLHLTANTKVEYCNHFHQKLGDPTVYSIFLMTN